MNDLKRSLEDLIDDTRLPDPPSMEDLRARTNHAGHRVHRSGRLLTVIAIVVVVSAVILAINDGPRSSTLGSAPGPATGPARAPAFMALGPRIAQPQVLAAKDGKLWVTGISPDQGPATLQEFDEKTGRVLNTIHLPDNWPGQIAVSDNAIWLRTQQGEESTHLIKVDATTHQIVADVTLQKDGGLAVTGDATWTVNGSLGLLRIDPRTGQTIATIQLPGGMYAPLVLTSGPLGVFLGSSYDGSILRVDEQTNTVSLITHIGTQVDQMVELGGSLWVSTGSSLVDMPVSTDVPDRTVELGAPILSLASDGRSLWVATDKPKAGVFRVDPTSGQITPVALPADVAGVLSVASDSTTGSTWATATLPAPSLVRLAR